MGGTANCRRYLDFGGDFSSGNSRHSAVGTGGLIFSGQGCPASPTSTGGSSGDAW